MSSREEYKKVIKNIKNINININNIDLWKNHFYCYYYYVGYKLHLVFLGFEMTYIRDYGYAYYGAYGCAYGYNF